VVVLAILGFPLAVALASAFEATPGGVRREVATLPTTVAAEPPPASVAVLPFVDMSESQDQGYFCDGVAEEILNSLTQVRGLSVAARTSSFRFRGPAGDIAEIARRLNVATVLEGSVRKAGGRLRVTAQLVAAKDGFHLWSERFDVEASDVFAVQDSIAAAIVGALRVSLHAEDRQLMQSGQTRSVEAYDHYLRGLSHFHAFNMRRMEHARQMFLKAIEVDPQFGRAWAGLAYAAGYLAMKRPDQARHWWEQGLPRAASTTRGSSTTLRSIPCVVIRASRPCACGCRRRQRPPQWANRRTAWARESRPARSYAPAAPGRRVRPRGPVPA